MHLSYAVASLSTEHQLWDYTWCNISLILRPLAFLSSGVNFLVLDSLLRACPRSWLFVLVYHLWGLPTSTLLPVLRHWTIIAVKSGDNRQSLPVIPTPSHNRWWCKILYSCALRANVHECRSFIVVSAWETSYSSSNVTNSSLNSSASDRSTSRMR